MTTAMQFRKKPVVIEAVQYTEEIRDAYLFDNVPLPAGVYIPAHTTHPPSRTVRWAPAFIDTLEGRMEVSIDDWVITGVKGERYACKPDIFAATYEPAASLRREEQGEAWQPIETAPKNKTVLVGYWNQLGKWRTVKATYYPPQTLPLHEDYDWDDLTSDGYAAEGWYEETETHETIMPLECDPVRWMPLPAEPIQSNGGEGRDR